MSKLMRKYVTVYVICQQIFYEIIGTNGNNHKNHMNFIRRFYGMSLMFAYLCPRVNDFRTFHACHSQLSTGGTSAVSGVLAANWLIYASSASKHLYAYCQSKLQLQNGSP